MRPKGYVRSLWLGGVVVPIGVTFHAQVDEKSAHQGVFQFGLDATPLGLEVFLKAVAPISTDEEPIYIIRIKSIAPNALIFPHS